MKKLVTYSALPLALVLLASCGDKTDANRKNFGDAISAYLEKKGEVCLDARFPAKVSSWDDQKHVAKLKAFGVVEKGRVPSGWSDTEAYVLTEEGLKNSRPYSLFGVQMSPNERQLCFAQQEVDEVVKWQGPMEMGDYAQVMVEYTYKLKDMAAWAKDPDIQEAFPEIREWVKGEKNEENMLMLHLTSEGWEPMPYQ